MLGQKLQRAVVFFCPGQGLLLLGGEPVQLSPAQPVEALIGKEVKGGAEHRHFGHFISAILQPAEVVQHILDFLLGIKTPPA